MEKAHSAPLKPTEKHVSFADPKHGHLFVSNHDLNAESVPFEQDQLQLWINVIEGMSRLSQKHLSALEREFSLHTMIVYLPNLLNHRNWIFIPFKRCAARRTNLGSTVICVA
jgi:hypothetical protein